MPDPQSRGTALRRLFQGGVAALVAAAIYLGYSVLFGGALGDRCDITSECSWSGTGHRLCLQTHWAYCTRPCVALADCPPGWRCGRHKQPERVCLRPPKKK